MGIEEFPEERPLSRFVEKIYENALGQFVTDLLVGDRVIVEVKAAAALHRDFELQCLNYLRATGLKVCLLLNFGRRRLEFRRLVLSSQPAYTVPDTFPP